MKAQDKTYRISRRLQLVVGIACLVAVYLEAVRLWEGRKRLKAGDWVERTDERASSGKSGGGDLRGRTGIFYSAVRDANQLIRLPTCKVAAASRASHQCN